MDIKQYLVWGPNSWSLMFATKEDAPYNSIVIRDMLAEGDSIKYVSNMGGGDVHLRERKLSVLRGTAKAKVWCIENDALSIASALDKAYERYGNFWERYNGLSLL